MSVNSWLSFPLFLYIYNEEGNNYDIFVFVDTVMLDRQLPLCLLENKLKVVKICEIISFNLLSRLFSRCSGFSMVSFRRCGH